MITDRITTKNSSGLGNTKEYIVLHHTWTGEWSLPGVLRGFQQWVVSAHYVIDTDGAIVACNTDDDILRHAGPSSWDGKTNINRYSIGIEVIGPLPGFTDAQRVSLRRLVSDLIQKYTIPAKNIIRHKDIAPGRKVDPDDSLRSVAYPSYAAYQNSYAAVQSVVGFYQHIFQKEFADAIDHGEVLIQDIDGVVQKVTNPDGSINISELVYFVGIGLERLHQEVVSLEKQQTIS